MGKNSKILENSGEFHFVLNFIAFSWSLFAFISKLKADTLVLDKVIKIQSIQLNIYWRSFANWQELKKDTNCNKIVQLRKKAPNSWKSMSKSML